MRRRRQGGVTGTNTRARGHATYNHCRLVSYTALRSAASPTDSIRDGVDLTSAVAGNLSPPNRGHAVNCPTHAAPDESAEFRRIERQSFGASGFTIADRLLIRHAIDSRMAAG